MSVCRGSPLSSPQNGKFSNSDLKQRVFACLNKLSDRDTLAVAAAELDSIAKNLPHEAFSPFLNCLSATDSSEKSLVRRQCILLLGVLSSAHGDALSPHVSKMLNTVVRRLRDSESAVRAACVDSVGSMASHITKPPFSSFMKPLVEAILHEQDQNSQVGSALCLAAAVEAAPDPDPGQLQKLLPRLLKLVESECFKAKPALLSLIGSIVSTGGALSRSVSNGLVPCLVEFLSSKDWAARKAAAETLARLAVAERALASEFKSSCLASLESRRFDKVKVVRETMNRTLELWKEVPDVADRDSVSPESISSSSAEDDGVGGSSPPLTKSSTNGTLETPKSKNSSEDKSPSSATVTQKRSPPKGDDWRSSMSMFNKLQCMKSSNWNAEIALPQPAFSKMASENDVKDGCIGVSDSKQTTGGGNLRLGAKQVLLKKTIDEKSHRFSGFRSGSRVVPFHDNGNSELIVADSNIIEDVDLNYKDAEDLCLIRKQLLQIENQQSSLLDLLQRFIGSSQSGIHSLETRVNGLEKALDEISHDLAVSTRRVSNSMGNTCCMIPGAEFLSPRFWRKTEGHFSASRFSCSGRNRSLAATRNLSDAKTQMLKEDIPKDEHQNGGSSSVSPMADTRRDLRGKFESRLNKIPMKIQDAEKVQAINAGGHDGASLANYIPIATLNSRSSVV